MNCFDWQNHVSDYLDGALLENENTLAEAHLHSCRSCRERHEHYKSILSAISSQRRSTLPIPIRKAPLSAITPRLDVTKISRSRWERIPWYLRTAIEGGSIVFLILIGISVGPKIRQLYERGLEKNLSEYVDNSYPTTPDAPPADAAPLTRGTQAQVAPVSPEQDDFAAGENPDDTSDDVEGENAGEPDTDDPSLRARAGEIWRFNLKTDSPHEIRPRIVKVLTDLRVPAAAPGVGGVEAPGGIQFDVLVSPGIVLSIKHQLQKITPLQPGDVQKVTTGDIFTWYKNRSRRPLPSGKTRVVIWLSQMM